MRGVRSPSKLVQDKSFQSNNKIEYLQHLLSANRNAKKKLSNLLITTKARIKELEEAGAQTQRNQKTSHHRKQPLAICDKKPQSLIDQMHIRSTPYREINFSRAIGNRIGRATQICLKKLGKNPNKIKFEEHCRQNINLEENNIGPIGVYKKWRQVHLRKQNSQKKKKERKQYILQQEEECLLFIERKQIYGENWEKLGFCYNGLSFEDIYSLYHSKLCNRDLKRWSIRHNILMIALVEYFGKGKWASVSKFIKIKSQFQCRERFCNILDPNVTENIWNAEDQEILLQVAKQNDYKWSKIVKNVQRFETKTDNALRRKFRNILMKYEDEKINNILADKPELAKSIKKFKVNYYNRGKSKKKKEEQDKDNNKMKKKHNK